MGFFKGDPVFYFGSIRKIILAVGTLFTDVKIGRWDADGNLVGSPIKVPLAYSEGERFVLFNEERITEPQAITSQNPADTKLKLQNTYPRMSYEFAGLQSDPKRKKATMGRLIRQISNGSYVMQLNPMPYDFGFTLTIGTEYTVDAAQILEQILPNFTPSLTVTVLEIPEMGLTYDVPVILGNIEKTDTYGANTSDPNDRIIRWKINFVAKGNLYPPIRNTGIIKKVITNLSNYTTGKKIAEIDVTVDPFSAGPNDIYTVSTNIYEDTQLDSNGNPTNEILNMVLPGIYTITGFNPSLDAYFDAVISSGTYSITGFGVTLT